MPAVGVIVDDGSLALIDTSGRPGSYEALADALAGFGRPVRTIYLTHGHADHVAGTGRFGGADVVASAATAEALAAEPPTPVLQQLHPPVADELAGLSHPAVTSVVDQARSPAGRLELEVLGGHSGGDLVVHVPDADVVFAGDLCFFGHVPLGIGADFERWAHSLEVLADTSRAVVVPGHGPVGGPAELGLVAEYVTAVTHAAANGTPIPAGPWSSWFDPWADRLPDAIGRINVEQAREPGAWPPTLLHLLDQPQ